VTYVLGIDVSTTATKALILDRQGTVVASGVSTYPYETPRALWSEQDPELWWSGSADAIGSALRGSGIRGEEIEGVGLAGQMHGLVALDGDLEPVRPAILWNDQRTQVECELIRATIGREQLIAITGNDALPGFTAPKLVWVRRHEPELWSRIAHVLLPKDFVRLRLTDGLAVDRADGAGTLLLDLAGRDWSNEVLDLLAIDRAWMPPTHEGAVAIRRPPPWGWARPSRGSCAFRSARPAWSSPRPRVRCSKRRAGSTRSATPCPVGGTSWA
jgi:xylulokinase